jgi:hypothetical protein
LRQQGRDEEAPRFELMHRNLPLVRSENQLIADVLIIDQHVAKRGEQSRLR